jgi:two-component system, NarL family, response regulator DesR
MKKRIKIVIVDDNPIFLKGLLDYMSNDTYEIMASFASGIELLSYINYYDPDIVLLDIQMPGMTGLEAAIKLNYYDDQLKLVAITLYSESLNVQQLIKAGFRGMIGKNDIHEQLDNVIKKVLHGELAF